MEQAAEASRVFAECTEGVAASGADSDALSAALRAHRVFLRQLGRARGRASETQVLRACQLRARPEWMRAARAATTEEDHHGIDVVVDTDVGKLHVQVKSSIAGKIGFLDKRPRARVAIIVVRRTESTADLLRRIVVELTTLRAIFLAKREASLPTLPKSPRKPQPRPSTRAPAVKEAKQAAAIKSAKDVACGPVPMTVAGAPVPADKLVDWPRLRDHLLAALLADPCTEADLQRTLDGCAPGATVREVVARSPGVLRQDEQGRITATVSQREAYALRLSRLWEPIPGETARRTLDALARLAGNEPICLADLTAMIVDDVGGDPFAEPVGTVMKVLTHAGAFAPAGRSQQGRVLVLPREWVRRPGEARERIERTAEALMGPFLPVDRGALREVLWTRATCAEATRASDLG